MAERWSDDEVLDALAVALRPDAAAEPSMAELTALQSVVASAGGSGATRSGSSWRRWLAGLGVVVVVGSGGTAYAANPSAPRGVRSLAHAVRLPGVESPRVTDARKALDDLEKALGRGRPDDVRSELEDVDEEVRGLSAEERASLEPRLGTLVGRAQALLAADAGRAARERDDEVDTGSSDSGRSGGDDRRVEGSELDDDRSGSSGSGTSDDGSSGSGSSGSGSDSSGSGTSGSGTSGSGTSGSGSGSGTSGSGTSGSGTSGTSGSGTSDGSGTSGSGSSGSGTSGSGTSGSGTSGGSGDSGSSGGSDHVDADHLDD